MRSLILFVLAHPTAAALPVICPRPVPAHDDGNVWLLSAALIVCVAGRLAAPRR